MQENAKWRVICLRAYQVCKDMLAAQSMAGGLHMREDSTCTVFAYILDIRAKIASMRPYACHPTGDQIIFVNEFGYVYAYEAAPLV